jgi:hypothetical protein
MAAVGYTTNSSMLLLWRAAESYSTLSVVRQLLTVVRDS